MRIVGSINDHMKHASNYTRKSNSSQFAEWFSQKTLPERPTPKDRRREEEGAEAVIVNIYCYDFPNCVKDCNIFPFNVYNKQWPYEADTVTGLEILTWNSIRIPLLTRLVLTWLVEQQTLLHEGIYSLHAMAGWVWLVAECSPAPTSTPCFLYCLSVN